MGKGDTIRTLKEKVMVVTGCPLQEQRILKAEWATLKDECMLVDFGLREGMEIRMGKVEKEDTRVEALVARGSIVAAPLGGRTIQEVENHPPVVPVVDGRSYLQVANGVRKMEVL